MALPEPIVVLEPGYATLKYFNKFWKFHKFLRMGVPRKMLLKSFVDSNVP